MGLSLAGATLGAGIIGGAASAFGGAYSANAAAKAAEAATKRQIEWERERATHAHQWEVEDLKKAGLNPILSAGGSGAVTGGISAPVPDTSGYAQAGNALFQTINTAIEAKKIQSEIALQTEQAANLRQDTANKFSENGLIQANIDMKLAELGLMPHKTAEAKARAEIAGVEAEFARARQYASIVRDYAGSVGAIVGAGGLSAMAVSKLARAKNHVPMNKNYERYGGFEQTPYMGNYL